MKHFLAHKSSILIYFIFLSITLLLSLNFSDHPVDNRFVKSEEIPFDNAWQYDYLNGVYGTTTLPNDLPLTNSHTLVLSNTIPSLSQPTSFFFRARHTSVKIYIDHNLLIDTTTTQQNSHSWFTLDGIYYHELTLLPSDSGKEIRIESYGNISRYLTKPGNIYLGDRGTFFLQLLTHQSHSLICAFSLLIIALMLFILWALSTFVLKYQFKEVLCLCLFTLSISLWLFTESQCLQFFYKDAKQITIFAYEILMTTPFPIALFFYFCSDRPLSQKHSHIAALIPLLTFIINNSLHFLGIVNLANSLIVIQVMLVFETLFIAYIQVSEIIYKRKTKNMHNTLLWKIPLFGIGLLVPMATLEIAKYIFAVTQYPNNGILISLGVIFYILSLTIDSVIRLAYTSIKLKQSAEMKTQFLANMSHDIRTPLNAILSFNEVILRITSEKKVREYAANIQVAGKTLKDIINSILDITKIESGKLTIYTTPYNTLQFLNNVITIFENLAEKKGLQFILNIDDELPETLIGDETHIIKVLTNILSNAVKYTISGSIIFTVKLISFSEESLECKIYFSIKDTGIGIKKEDQKRLFEKFERLDQEINYNVEGTGLGMSIVTQLLQAMDSKIELESEYGIGSNFFFTLTQLASDRSTIGNFSIRRQKMALENDPNVNFIAPDAHILIVDDVQMNLEAVSALLEPTKIQIDTSLSGSQALEMLLNKKYHLILMDHMMPEMDGIETTEKIRALTHETNDAYYTELPIIALTANAMVGMKENFLRSGMQDFISKPIDVISLDRIIKKWLPNSLIQPLHQAELSIKEAPLENDDWPIPPDCIELSLAKEFNPTYELYLKNLHRYVDGYNNTETNLIHFQKEQDEKNYCITVHGLKSTSKMIGAAALYSKALLLEEACHEENLQYVWDETPHLLSMYKDFVQKISSFLEIQSTPPKRLLSIEEYNGLLLRIKKASDHFDMGEFMMLEDELNRVIAPEDKREDFKIIKQMIAEIGFTKLSQYLSTKV